MQLTCVPCALGISLTMDRIVYDRMAAHDSTHWWYRARRDILSDYLTRYGGLPEDARILEIGCGTGHNLPMLARFGHVEAIEIDEAARAIAGERLGRPIGDAPELAAVVEELFPTEAMHDIHAFYGSGGDDAELTRRITRLMESCAVMGADRDLDVVATSRYAWEL